MSLRILLNVYFTGTAGNSLAANIGSKFSTHDVDNDDWRTVNCAVDGHGAWWYRWCTQSNLNGEYLGGRHSEKGGKGISWYHFKGYRYSLKFAEMKVAPQRH